MTQYRQGDVMLVAAEIPKGSKPGLRDQDRIVLAYGEVTGHAHAIADPACAIFVGSHGTPYIRAKKAVELKHEEHGTIKVPAGSYRVVRQREYSPEAIRQVAD